MHELSELRNLIEKGEYADALSLLGEIEEMSREDKINKIQNFIMILLLHQIKKKAENRSTPSWEKSIFNALYGIYKTNKMRSCKTNKLDERKGYYLYSDGLIDSINEVYPVAMKNASYEAFGGINEADLKEKIDEKNLKKEAFTWIAEYHKNNE